jgi:hypothetical protein
MAYRPKNLWLCGLLLLAALVGGCTTDANDSYIQGNWHHVQQRSRSVYHNPAEDIDYWTFDRGTYIWRSCCLHNHYEDGRYRIASSEGDSITLQLYETGRQQAEGRQIRISIDRDQGTLRINATGPYVFGNP